MPTLRTNEGSDPAQRTGALITVDLAALAPPDAGSAASLALLQVQCDGWAASPELYAVILRANAAPARIGSTAREDLAALTRLAWRFECFPKPLVALIDTHISFAALTLTQFTTHRVGGAAYRFAVPTLSARGGLPLAGIAHTLARLPGATGMYLAMSGHTIGPADALALGLLTHTIADANYPDIIAALADALPIDPLLDAYPPDPAGPSLAPHRAAIARCFSAASPDGIATALAAERGANAAWARDTLSALGTKSGTELAVTHRLISEASQLDVRASLHLSHSIALQLHAAGAQNPPPLDILFAATNTDFLLPARSELVFGRF